ncbi:M23 family metallopeptidase [Desulfovibrio sp. OttesenSCG-928-M16]|nr:M23 family metallopeptidase [Desulfovibrio sp. OttesenSCG-928-M16]
MARKRSRLSLLILILLAGMLIGGGYLLFQDSAAPEIVLSHKEENIAPALPMTITVTDKASPIKRLAVIVRFKENIIPVLEHEFNDGKSTQEITFTLEKAGLKHNDTFDLEITAVDDSLGGLGFGNKGQVILPMRLDAQPPRMSVKSSAPYVRRGGSACVVYSINKEVLQTGVKVNDLFFPAFRRDNGDYLCFFAFPYFLESKEYAPQLVALDQAGNTQVTELPVNRMPRQFKTDTINIGQGFLDAKAVEFESIYPGTMSDIDRFLAINGQVRKDNALTLLQIGRNTAPEMIWKGAFLRLPRSAPRADFADHRTYLWQGQKVDEQTHLGFDLASVKQAPVPASNSGVVVFAGYLGIYGNLIVLDHGLGLQSLYSHLSEIGVEEGQSIQRGDIIGKTGATGMAGGDHLHYGILVSGLEVTPREWLDDHWIKDNIVDRIKDAGGTAPEFEVASPPAKKQNTKKKR